VRRLLHSLSASALTDAPSAGAGRQQDKAKFATVRANQLAGTLLLFGPGVPVGEFWALAALGALVKRKGAPSVTVGADSGSVRLRVFSGQNSKIRVFIAT
jgi:hypothetical protein